MIDDIRIQLEPVFDKYLDYLSVVYLFGSTAMDNATSGSDLDIAVLFKPDTAFVESSLRFKLYADISRKLKRNDVDLVILNSSSNLILQDEIIRNGVAIFEADTEVRDQFEERVLHCSIDFRHQRMMFMGA